MRYADVLTGQVFTYQGRTYVESERGPRTARILSVSGETWRIRIGPLSDIVIDDDADVEIYRSVCYPSGVEVEPAGIPEDFEARRAARRAGRG